MFLVMVGLLLLIGLLAALTLAVLSVDLPRLTVWIRIRSSERSLVWLYTLCLNEADYRMPKARALSSSSVEPFKLATGVPNRIIRYSRRGAARC